SFDARATRRVPAVPDPAKRFRRAGAEAAVSALAGLVERLRESRGFRHKNDISHVLSRLRPNAQSVAIGDDCAAIPDGDGYLLFAIEGMVSDFVRSMPWFAGYSGVMV